MKKTWIVALSALLVLGTAAVAGAQEATPPAEDKQSEGKGRLRERFSKVREHRGILLHKDATSIKQDGTLVETRVQRGIITAVNGQSITLKSPGDYVQTYRIDGETKILEKRRPSSVAGLAVGEMAVVRAVKSGSGYLAKVINCTGEPGPRLKELLERR
ncbi:MAG: hypothetical protein ACT4OM_03750 [Actinomycetota bacterium]